MNSVGFATSIPVEVLFAASVIPVDLNNVFINDANPQKYVDCSEENGYPRNICSWIKGIYTVVQQKNIRTVISVREGECSHNEKLSELLLEKGVDVIPFSYPHERNERELKDEIERLMRCFNVEWTHVTDIHTQLNQIRDKIHFVDRMSYERLTVSSFENYVWQIASTDFGGSFSEYEKKLDYFIAELKNRQEGMFAAKKRIGVIGIPTIVSNFFQVIEELNGVVVYNEMPRQFSMINCNEGIVRQYLNFTYPYALSYRISDIQQAVTERCIDGIIHYVQSFCPRQVEDMTLRRELDVPYITIECDRPGVLDERNTTRLEAFFERLY